MPGTKLFDLESKSNVEVDPSEVKAALATGRFAFGKGLNVPIIRDGAPMWVKPEYAHKYSDDLTFTTDEVVRSAQAESEYSGVGGIAKGLAYGGFKGATLGLGPLALGAASPAAREEMANAELGAPRATLAGEAASLLFDPIAAGARAFGKGAAKGAGLAVEKGAERVIAKEPLLLGEGAIPRRLGPGPLPSGEVDTRIGQGLRAQSRELPGDGVIKGLLDVGGEGAGPPRLGGKLPSAEAAGETARDIRTRLVGVPALPEKGVIRLGEMPSTLTGPPLESRLMTDLRNEQANLADRMIGLDKVISTEEKSRGKGSGAVLKILRGERDDVASRIEEYEFQLMKYERPEETALAEQAGRAEEQAAMGRYQTSFPDAHVLPGARRDILAEQRVAADAVMSARETKATEDARAAVMREGLPAEYTGRRPTAGGRTELATTARRPGIAEVMAAQDAALAELQLGRDAAATSELRASLEADAATPPGQPDLLNMSQADLVEHYASNGLPKGVSAYDALTARPSLRGKSQAEIMEFYKANGGTRAGRAWADDMEKTWSKLRNAPQDGMKAKGAESDWTNFVVGADTHVAGSNRSKAYATLKDPLALSGDRVEAFLKALRSEGYNGQVKVPASGARALTGFDNIVMHGASEADAALGESAAKRFFGSELEGTAQGVDIGKKSHTTLLADELEKRLAAGPSPGMGITPAGGQELGLSRPMQQAMPGSPMLGAGPGAFPGVAGQALPQLGAGPAAPGLAGAAGGVGGGAGQVAGVAGGIPGAVGGLSLPRAVVEGGVYSAASQANRQQLGLEPGGVGEVAEAGLLGMGLGAAGHVLGKALGGGAKAFGSAVAGDAPAPAMTRIAKAAHGIQDAHLMRMWGTDAAAIERLNREFTDTPAGKKGVSAFADFIRAETADISALKAVSPQDAILQAIPSGVPLKFAQLTPERRTAISDAIRAKLGKQYDEALAPLDGVVIPQTGLAGVIKTMRASRIKGLGDETLRSIAPEFEAFTKSVAAGETQTVGSLREMRGAMDESFSIRNGLNKEFTKPQLEFRTALNNLVNEQMEVLAPGASAKFAALNKQYSMAKILQEGVISAETKFAASSPFNKETLSKAALGVAIGQPYGAAKFFVANAMLRGLYNSRGEGFIADMAGSVERAALNIGKDPVGAAKIASRSVLDAKRPIMMATNAERFVSGEPEDFINMSKAVRLLQSAKDEARQQVLRATSNLPVGEQQRVAAEWEAKIDALASSLPKGLSTGNALSEHEKRFVIFARSILDPAYATQVIANGGPEATDAANAIRSIPGGQVYLSSLAEDIRTQISESKALRANENAGRVYMNFSKQINASARALTIHGGGGGGGGGGKTPSAMGMPKISASTHSAATKAIAASAAMTK